MAQLIGEIRAELQKEFIPNLETAINKAIKQHPSWKEFYILVHANHYGKDLYTKFMILPIEMNQNMDRVKVLGTMCFYVNAVAGDWEMVWALPFDIPTDRLVELEPEFVEVVAENISESKIPIIY